MRLKLLHDWVLIKRSEPEEKTAGGIIIPESAKDKPAGGIVEAIGPGRYKKEPGKKGERFVPTVLKPGQLVFFIDYAARDIEIDGEKVTLIREDDILGTFEGAGELTEKKSFQVEAKGKAEVKKAPKKRAVSKTKRPAAKTKTKKTVKPKKTGATKKPKRAVKKPAPPRKKTKTAQKKTGAKKKTAAKKTAPKKTASKGKRRIRAIQGFSRLRAK